MEVADAIDRARNLQMDGRPDEALDLLLAAAREHSNDDLRGEIALFYTERGFGRPDALAQEDFENALRWTDLPQARAGLASVLIRRASLKEAEEHLRIAFEANPEILEIQAAQAELLLARGEPEAAVAVLMPMLQRWPQDVPGYLLLSRTLAGLGRRDEARRVLEAGLLQDPGNDALQVAVAHFYAEAGNFERAGRAWRYAAEVNAENAEAWRGVAWAAAHEGDDLEMHTALDRAVALDAEKTRAWLESPPHPALKAYVA